MDAQALPDDQSPPDSLPPERESPDNSPPADHRTLQRLEEAEKRSRRLKALTDMTRNVSAAMSVENLASLVARELAPVFSSDGLVLIDQEPDPSTLCARFTHTTGGTAGREEKRFFSLYQSPFVRLIEQGEGSLSPFTSDLAQLFLGPHTDMGEGWMISVPVRGEVGIPAALLLIRQGKTPFSEDERVHFQEFAEQIAPALQNIQLYQELMRSNHQLREAQEQIVQSERLRALGEMAGGVAHDFNNSLAAILGNAEMALQHIDDPNSVRRRFEIIRQAALDAAETVKRIQDFSRARASVPFEGVNLGEITQTAMEITRPFWRDEAHAKGFEIQVLIEIEPRLRVYGNASELRETLINLIMNAIQAMPTGGSLRIRGRVADDRVLWSITDTGVGIHEDDQHRIFEPFYTTKGRQGTGLGLSVSHGIIRKHAGLLTVQSRPGEGATFTLSLPLHDEPTTFKLHPSAPLLSRSLHILVVEDEDLIRNLIQEILQNAGQIVDTARDGTEALALVQSHSYDLIVTDHGMPGLNGLDLARTVKHQHPNLPILLLTGWGHTLQAQQGNTVDAVLSKPVQMEELLAAVAKITPK